MRTLPSDWPATVLSPWLKIAPGLPVAHAVTPSCGRPRRGPVHDYIENVRRHGSSQMRRPMSALHPKLASSRMFGSRRRCASDPLRSIGPPSVRRYNLHPSFLSDGHAGVEAANSLGTDALHVEEAAMFAAARRPPCHGRRLSGRPPDCGIAGSPLPPRRSRGSRLARGEPPW